jgi:hypothetical protein
VTETFVEEVAERAVEMAHDRCDDPDPSDAAIRAELGEALNDAAASSDLRDTIRGRCRIFEETDVEIPSNWPKHLDSIGVNLNRVTQAARNGDLTALFGEVGSPEAIHRAQATAVLARAARREIDRRHFDAPAPDEPLVA